jgi:hypothetical protein
MELNDAYRVDDPRSQYYKKIGYITKIINEITIELVFHGIKCAEFNLIQLRRISR